MSRLKLGDVEWGLFKIGDLFEIENGKCSKVSELKNGHVPYVGATNRNNGVLSFVENKSELLSKGNCLVFICDGEGSIGYSIYKNEDFVGTTTIKIGRNKSLNKYNGLFITTVADTVRGKYNFGYKRNEQHLKAETLQLPIDMFGNPNWQFMEDYIKQEQKILAQKVIDYYEQKTLGTVYDLPKLEDIEWKAYFFNDIFISTQRGKRLTKANQVAGEVPYISSTSFNNGVARFIGNKDKIRYSKNNLTLANSGSVGSCFYHAYEYIPSDHVTSLTLEKADKYVYLFVSTIAKRLEEKYSFNREISDKRINKERLILPVDENGDPHWEYMSKYMQNLEKENIRKILEYMHGYINKS